MGAGGASEKYRLGERIGGGGMAEVFEATLMGAEGFARPVAVKRMIPTLSVDPAFGQMFVNEARIASLLHHANIGAVLDFDRDPEGRYFIVMELIRGLDLRRLADSGRLPIGSSVHIVSEMLRGLDYAHELEHEGSRLGVVHRDISPHNVMLSWDGAVKVVDFGIAKILAATGVSRTGTIKGKLAYMSPEQAGAAELDGRSDLFSVGVVLHELLTGQRLFRGQTEPEVLARLLTQPIPRPSEVTPDVPADLDGVVMWLLERDRDRRAPSAHDALDALLGTAAASTRGALDLQRLLTERFPDKAPKRRGMSSAASQSGSGTPSRATPSPATPSPVTPGTITPATPTAVTQISPVEATLPQTPAALAAVTPVSTPAPTPTLTAPPMRAMAVETPVPAPVPVPARRRRPWVAGVVVAAAAAAASAGVLLARRGAGSGDERVASASPADAAPVPTPTPTPAPAPAPAPAPSPSPTPSPSPSPSTSTSTSTSDAAPPPAQPEPRTSKPSTSSSSSKRSGPPGKVHVVVLPWAEVTIDGKRRGTTPLTIDLAPGPHKVSLHNREAGKTETVNVTIESGKTTDLERDWN